MTEQTPDIPVAHSAEFPFLDLLSRDASADRYDRPLDEARAAGAPPERLAALDRARSLALRIRGSVHEQQRREAELAALFETVGDLAGRRELDDVLHAIVVRARRLLNTEVAYLSLNDTRAGDTYMRVTAGSVSAKFQQVRLGLGEGLGGLVAQTSSPYVTADYFKDARFRHTDPIDTAVREEGLVAILGVPLEVNAKVIGVLFAADRRVRPFSRNEVALLGSLAAHAAIAIESANQLAETKAALVELGAANRKIRAHSAATDRAVEMHETLTGAMLRGAGVGELAAAMAEVLGGRISIVDEFGRPLTDGSAVDPALTETEHGGRAVYVGGRWIAAVLAGSERLGTLILSVRPDLDSADQRILERGAMVAALRLLTERSVRDAEDRVRGDLVTDLLYASEHAEPDLSSLWERARRVNADLDARHVVVVAQVQVESEDLGGRRRLAAAAAHLAATRRGLAGERAGLTVLILPGEDPTAIGREVVRQLRGAVQHPVTGGAAGPVCGVAAFAGAYQEAARVLSALRALGRDADAASSRDLGFVGLLLGGGVAQAQVPAFVESVLSPVLEYDARRSTELVRTLEVYFSCGGQIVKTKDILHVHVNTVTQRLDRIAHLLGPDWNSPERSLELQLALRLHRLR